MADEIYFDVFTIQWHITHSCQYNCKHCYVENNTEEIPLDKKKLILTYLLNVIVGEYKLKINFNWSGGDVFHREDDFWALLNESKKIISSDKERFVNPVINHSILGNPDRLINNNLRRINLIKEHNIVLYQLSLDGKKAINDQIRGEGHYEKTLKAIQVLKKNNIKAQVMFTLSKLNVDELFDVMTICSDAGVDIFSFESVIPTGKGANLKNQMLNPLEFKEVLIEYNDFIEKSTSETEFARKSCLFTLLEYEKGKIDPLLKELEQFDHMLGGCSIGFNQLSILPNGDVYGCRRMPIKVGKFPEEKFIEVFKPSKERKFDFPIDIKELMRKDNLETCGNCKILQLCAGCRARAMAMTGNYLDKDPICWK